ncbi:transglutaminase family protein [Nocardioides limicola]|uniref:transglutaminase family protein n=1 Tax=Nocardioides limicola TaxID=2803368 RepID=UPI00193C774E|nr:transglutaminase family protein [Nocardioides sp. DJM-14]
MQLRIVHTTGFSYDDLVSASYNEARLTPQTTTEQLVVHSRVDVTPHPWTYTYRDYWGSMVTAFEVLDPHRELTVTATSTVHTQRPAERPATLDWADLREQAVTDDLAEYVAAPDRVAPPDELARATRDLVAGSDRPGDVAKAVCSLVHSEIEYLPGSTHVHARAAEAWEQRSGVCQDMAHLVIGALRTVGIPARYVSGYLLPTAQPAVGEQTHGESHAWVEWWDDGWRAFDPTNAQPPGECHVTVATGRDYADVRPLNGIYTGAAASQMFVEVQMTRLA